MNKPAPLSKRQYDYFLRSFDSWFNVAEGGKRGGKNVLATLIFCTMLETHKNKIHLVAGVSSATAKLNILDCDGYGLLNYFEGRCREGKYKDRDCVYVQTKTGEKIVLVSGGGKDGDEKLIKGNTYGMAYAILDGIGDLCPALDPVIDAIKNITDNLDDVALAAEVAAIAFVGLKAGMAIQSAVKGFQEAKLTIALFKASAEGANIAQAALNGTLTLGETAVALFTGQVSLAELATAGLSKAQGILNAVMSANPITLIVIAIAALVAIFVVLWNKCDWFREFWIGLWENIKEAASNALDAVVTFFTETIPNFIQSIVDWFNELPERLTEWGENVYETVTTAVQNTIESAVQFFSELPNKIAYCLGFCIGKIIKFGIDIVNWAITELPKFVDSVIKFFAELPGKAWKWLANAISKVSEFGSNLIKKGKEAGLNFVKSLVDFIKTAPNRILMWLLKTIDNVMQFKEKMIRKAVEAGKGFVDKLIDGVKSLPDQMQTIGKNIVDGIWKGISGGWKWLGDKVNELANSLFEGAKAALDIHSPSKKFKWIGEMCVAGIDEPLEDYNPYDTLNKSMKMNAGVMTINHRYSAGGTNGVSRVDYKGMADAFAYALGKSGLTVKVNNRDFGRVIREVVS